MSTQRPFALVQSDDQWLRCAHENTALLPGVVQLRFEEETPPKEPEVEGEDPPPPAGLAFDPWCRLYHSIPEKGQVERIDWSAKGSATSARNPVPLFTHSTEVFGDFRVSEFETTQRNVAAAVGDAEGLPRSGGPTKPWGSLKDPRSLAVDRNGYLFVAETGAARVLVFDLAERRMLELIRFDGGARPLDLAGNGRRVFALLDRYPFVVRLNLHRGSRTVEFGNLDIADFGQPSRLAIKSVLNQDDFYLLVDAGTDRARVIPLARPDESIAVPMASDLELVHDRHGGNDAWHLVVARGVRDSFARFSIGTNFVVRLSDLRARAYDGRGIVQTPDGRIGYWSSQGFRHAAVARARYVSRGKVTTFRLDAGRFQTSWGRIFVDACIPLGTDLRVRCFTADEVLDAPTLSRDPPVVEHLVLHRPDLSPPMPPLTLINAPGTQQRLFRRPTGRELPWTAHEDEFATYEAPVVSGPGRYLWVEIELIGNTQLTPRIKSLRAEYPSHDLLRRLPKLYSRDPQAADFLRRYLAMFDGILMDLDGGAAHRHTLVDPRSTPAELLPWLASLIGLVLDLRWPEDKMRTLISEAVSLFRRRGTVGSLKRFLEIYLECDISIVEKFRLRGLGGAMLGTGDGLLKNAVVGSFRIGGDVAAEGSPSTSEPAATPNAFQTHAHRFSVVIPRSLDDEQLDVVRHVLDVHRPTHTLFEICTVDSGFRIGRGSYLELTTLIGHSGTFGKARLGRSTLNGNDVVGKPRPGVRVGSSKVGFDSRGG